MWNGIWQGKGGNRKRKEGAGERQIVWHFIHLRDVAKAADGSSVEAKARLRGCLAFDDRARGGRLSFTRCGMQVQIVLLHWDWWRDVHHPLRGRDEEREGGRVYHSQQIDVRLCTISQNPMKGRQEVAHSDRTRPVCLETTFPSQSICTVTFVFLLIDTSISDVGNSQLKQLFIWSYCPQEEEKSLQFSCQWVLLRRRPSIKRLREPAWRIASTTHWGSAGTQPFWCNSSNQQLFKDGSVQSVGSSLCETRQLEKTFDCCLLHRTERACSCKFKKQG